MTLPIAWTKGLLLSEVAGGVGRANGIGEQQPDGRARDRRRHQPDDGDKTHAESDETHGGPASLAPHFDGVL